MSFAQFCEKINSDRTFRERYISDPVGLVEDKLCIRLSDTQKNELRDTVKKLSAAIPDFKLYIAGQPFGPQSKSQQSSEPSPGPQVH